MRHSAAHILAYAVKNLFPDTKIAIGPVIDSGFYYDFDFKNPITEKDFDKITKEMKNLVKKDLQFEQKWISIEQAQKLFVGEPYKLEIINEIKKGQRDDFGQKSQVSIYQSGDFIDLCKGTHIESSKRIGNFQLLSIAGAYWKSNNKNTMLTRIYGTAFPTKKELDKYLWQIEEAKKRDHRKIGEKLELFTINERIGPGLILWLPKGNIIKEEVEKWAKQTEEERGYVRVATPHITKSGLYYTSGHLPYYKNDMYPSMKLDNGEEYFLKPMNCPHHHMIYAVKPRSYKELPLRLAEYGTVYRYESSGELFGLMRVRGMTQNDAHIYCTLTQAVDEFVKVMELHEYYYKSLGIKEYHLELSLRDPKNKEKYHGDDSMWKLAEKLMREAVTKTKIKMVEQIGNAAFYGPKIDFIIHSATGREFAISTNQIDLFMAKRFKLKYVDDHGREQTPVIIHRAPLGSHERFIGFLIEHYAGAFPIWLSPVQITILPISDKQTAFSQDVYKLLKSNNLRVELNTENKTIGNKIRESTLQKIPYMVIIGDKETQRSTGSNIFISVRTSKGENLGAMSLIDFIKILKEKIEKRV